MATIRWTGNAAEIAQVDTFTPAIVEIGDIFILTLTDPSGETAEISFTATAATVANVTAGLEAAWNASTNTLIAAITAADNTTNITLTADTAGDAFSVIATTTDGGGADTQTLSKASTTASAGPKHWDSVDNWDGGALPGGAASQDVYIDNFAGDILYGLDQSAIANALASLNLEASFTGRIGPNGATGKSGDYLQIKALIVNIGEHNGYGTPTASGRIKIDLGTTASTVNVYKTATPTDASDGKPAVRLLATHASTDVNVRRGTVGIAIEAGETSTINDIDVSYIASVTGDADVYIGSGVTMGDLSQTGGDIIAQCTIGTVNSKAGTVLITGSPAITELNADGATITLDTTGAITTLNANDGQVYPNNHGTIGTLNVDGAAVDFTQSSRARTVTTVKLNSGSLKYDPADMTFTNKVASDDAVTLTAAA
jgi:hypothetical protein